MTPPHFYSDDLIGKVYDHRLVMRLLAYVAPHKKIVFVSLLCMCVATALDLLVPFIAKEGIDRYLAALFHVAHTAPGDEDALRRADPAGTRCIPAGASAWLIRKTALQDLDSALRARLRDQGRLSTETYYIFPASARASGVGRVLGDYWLVPEDSLGKVPNATLLELRGADIRGITRLAVLTALLILLGLLAGYGHVITIQIAGQRSMYDLRTHLFKHIHTLSLDYLDRVPVGRLVTRVTNDIESLNEMFTAVLVTLARDTFLVIGSMAAILWLDLRLGLIAIAVVPCIVGVAAVFRVKMRGAYREVRRLLAQLNSDLAEDLNGLKVIQSFNREDARRARFGAVNEAYFGANMRQIVIFGVFRPIIEMLAMGGVALVLFFGGGAVVRGALTLGTLVAFVTYVRQMLRPIADMSEKYNIMQSAMAASDRIFAVLDRTPSVADPSEPVELPVVRGEIRFDSVSFAYEPGKQVLRNVSFTVPAGKSVAIVGPTGAGKTSVLNLLCRFYDPQGGAITLDGVDLRRLPLSTLAQHLAIVLQDAFVFTRTVQDNIRLGAPRTRDEVVQAAELVEAREFIERLPHGFEELMAERGATLSTGQKQLLCFARALAHGGPVLILDEATSSVDPATEKKIQAAIQTLMRGRTSIIVAHRLSTIRNADEILVIDDGRVLERGTHAELLAARGIYYNLYLLQYR